tara:strand:- start:9606 stop:10568 length:963 start_codon:yes stop_codon:yes gene_type:complete
MKLNILNFNNYLNKNYLFENNPSICVAVSGGPDSMALVLLLKHWIRLKRGKLIGLIVDHRMRYNSLQEAKSTFQYLKKLNVESKILRVNISKVKKNNMNEARINRYELLTNFCKKNNILHLFFGHHKNDNLETFLNRKIAGSDFEGLQSISANIIYNNINIIRPLLKYSKKQILEYNIKNKIDYIIDPSNINLNFTRPAIRNYLENANKNFINNIENDFKIINKYYSPYKFMISEVLIKNLVIVKPNLIKIDYYKFKKYNNLISEKIIKKIYSFVCKNSSHLRSSKIKILVDHIKKDNLRNYNLKGMVAKRDQNFLTFSK